MSVVVRGPIEILHRFGHAGGKEEMRIKNQKVWRDLLHVNHDLKGVSLGQLLQVRLFGAIREVDKVGTVSWWGELFGEESHIGGIWPD